MAGGVVMVGATSEEKASEHSDRLQSALQDLKMKRIPFLILSKAYEFGRSGRAVWSTREADHSCVWPDYAHYALPRLCPHSLVHFIEHD